MTILWGASCVDGVVLVVDSLAIEVKRLDDGRYVKDPTLALEKLRYLRRLRMLYAAAGTFDFQGEDSVHVWRWRRGRWLDDVADQIYALLLKYRGRSVIDDGPPQLLIGGGPVGSAPGLLWIEGEPARRHRVQVGEVVLGACMGWQHPQPIQYVTNDLTTGVALGLAMHTCHEKVRQVYRSAGVERLGDFSRLHQPPERGGWFPTIAFPLHVAVITVDEIHRYKVELVGDGPAEVPPLLHTLSDREPRVGGQPRHGVPAHTPTAAYRSPRSGAPTSRR